MSESKTNFAAPRQKALAVAVCVFASIVALTVMAAKLPDPRPENDPRTVADLKQAKLLGKGGDWVQAANMIVSHTTGPNPSAKLEYAILLSRGWGVERDRERVRQLLLQAVAFDFSDRGRAAFELGRLYKIASGEDCTRIALEWFIKAAQWDYAKAHLELGRAYQKGLGTEPNASKALRHYKIAAQGGSAAAIWSLVKMVEIGSSDLKPDRQVARSLAKEYMPHLIADARGGNAYAARTIARFHMEGRVVPHNRGRAGRWFTEAVRLGDPAAMHDLAQLMLPDGDADPTAILDLLRQSASRGYGAAASAMGRLHLQQKYGLPRKGAVDWFTQGITAGHGGAFEELGRLYLYGELVDRDPAEALRLAQMGAKLRHDGSLRLLTEIESTSGAAPKFFEAARSSARR